MTRLRATVRAVTGKTAHLQVVGSAGELDVAAVPDPNVVEVVEQAGAIYLLRLDDRGHCIADTWHESVDAAKEQATFEFGIEAGDWKEVEEEVPQR